MCLLVGGRARWELVVGRGGGDRPWLYGVCPLNWGDKSLPGGPCGGFALYQRCFCRRALKEEKSLVQIISFNWRKVSMKALENRSEDFLELGVAVRHPYVEQKHNLLCCSDFMWKKVKTSFWVLLFGFWWVFFLPPSKTSLCLSCIVGGA